VTGLAAGNASITATVTKGSQSASAGGQVAVSAAAAPPTEGTQTPATVSIAGIKNAAGNSIAVNAVKGDDVFVTLNVNPNDAKVTKVSLSIAGVKVASQVFLAGAFGESTQQITFHVDTTEEGVAYIIDEVAGTATVIFTNGEHPLVASVFSEGSEGAGTATVSIKLANDDTMIVKHELEEGFKSALDSNGNLWYMGDITVTAYPILFSGKVAKDEQIWVNGTLTSGGTAAMGSINIIRGEAADTTAMKTASGAVKLSEAPYRVTFFGDFDALNKLSARPAAGDTIRALTGFHGKDVGGAAKLKNFVGGGGSGSWPFLTFGMIC
jgi:hypothetical protein